MKIAFVDYVCDPAKPTTTGLSDIVWDMARRLASLGDDIHVIAPYTVDPRPEQGITVHRFPIPVIGYRNIAGHILIMLRAALKLRGIAGVDVVHAPEYNSTAVASGICPSIPVVFTEPGNIFERIENGNPYDWSTTQVYKVGARVTARRCAHMIATSDLMRTWWERTGTPPSRISVIPLGLDTSLFHPVPDARSRLGWNPDEFNVLYVARLSRENGADIAIRSLAQLRSTQAGVRLHIVGSGPEETKLRTLACELGCEGLVTFYGWVDLDLLPSYYSAANSFLFSGRSGGTPRTMLQAMACGAPVVASQIGGIVDHIENGESGILVPVGDVPGFAAGLVRLLDEPELRVCIAHRARTYATAHLDWDVLVPRIRSEVYEPAIRQAAADGFDHA